MENSNNNKAKVRQRLAYMFAGGLIGYIGARLAIAVVGIQIPENIAGDLQILATIAGNIIAFFIGGDIGKEKPES